MSPAAPDREGAASDHRAFHRRVDDVFALGIAKLFDPGASSLTASSEIGFTPGYASPEQRRGDPMTPATDIYSLGVVLQEMLTRDRRLPDDVAPTVLKALRQDPRDRYASVAELIADVRGHLTSAPVATRPNRTVLVAASAIVLTIIVALAVMSWQSRRTERRFQLELAGQNLRAAAILMSSSRPAEAATQATEGLTRALSYRAPRDLLADLYALRRRARLARADVAGAAADAEQEQMWRKPEAR